MQVFLKLLKKLKKRLAFLYIILYNNPCVEKAQNLISATSSAGRAPDS